MDYKGFSVEEVLGVENPMVETTEYNQLVDVTATVGVPYELSPDQSEIDIDLDNVKVSSISFHRIDNGEELYTIEYPETILKAYKLPGLQPTGGRIAEKIQKAVDRAKNKLRLTWSREDIEDEVKEHASMVLTDRRNYARDLAEREKTERNWS